jgi:GntR family transcriptional regulator/MocR family aminotransferase
MKRSSSDLMWRQLLRLSGRDDLSLQKQLRSILTRTILDGRVPTDVPLPSSRHLARLLGISRNTVNFAYQSLVAERYLLSREREGYFVNPAILEGRMTRPVDESVLVTSPNWRDRFRVEPSAQRNIEKPLLWKRFEYPFIFGQTDPTLFPVADWRECLRQAMSLSSIAQEGLDRVDRDDSRLVEQIRCRLLPGRGVWVGPENVLVTLGAQNALYLIARLLVGPDDVVGMENPGYPDARNLFTLHTTHVTPLTVDDAGMEVNDSLGDCDYVYVTPSHQSPTAATMSLERRMELLARANEADIVVIEDDYEPEMSFGQESIPALKSFDQHDRVLYVSSLSKWLSPGIRLGFMVGPAELIREARALRRLLLRHPPALLQAAVALFIELGHHGSHLNNLRHAYRHRRNLMDAALSHHLPWLVRTPSTGGTAVWLRGPAALDARRLAVDCAVESVLIEPGDVFFMSDPAPGNFFRLGFASIAPERIEPGIERLARIARKQLGGSANP